MCGLFGFIGTGPNKEALKEIALKSMTRGQDSFSIVWSESCREFNRIVDHPDNLSEQFRQLASKSYVVIIGHARLATGSPTENLADEGLQPFIGKRFAVAHNGVVYNYDDLRREYKIRKSSLKSDSDSEIIVRIIEKLTNPKQGPQYIRPDHFLDAVEAVDQKSALALIGAIRRSVYGNADLIVARRGQPLYFEGDAARGTYFCSVKTDYTNHKLPDNSICNFDVGGNINYVRALQATIEQTQSGWLPISPTKDRSATSGTNHLQHSS